MKRRDWLNLAFIVLQTLIFIGGYWVGKEHDRFACLASQPGAWGSK